MARKRNGQWILSNTRKSLVCGLIFTMMQSGCREAEQVAPVRDGMGHSRGWGIDSLIQADSTYLSVGGVMGEWGLAGLSLAVIEDYEILGLRTWGVKESNTGDSVDTQTAFSAASISKGVTATLLVLLEEQGRIDLKAPVNGYLKRWHLPENEYTRRNLVTLEHLLSHTGGTTQHGFTDFYAGDTLPTLVESLQGKVPGYDAPLEVVFTPGSDWQYSGGGYVLAQMAVEDHTGESLSDLAEEYLFSPLKMYRSTLKQPNEPGFLSNVAKAHDAEGKVIRSGIPITPQVAPSGLWSTPHDLALFILEIQKALAGRETRVITPSVAQRVTEIITAKGMGGWSLGWERFYGFGNREWFSHGGANTGTGGYVYGTLRDGHGIVILANGPNEIRMPVQDQLRNRILEYRKWYKPLGMPVRNTLPDSVIREVKGTYKHVVFPAVSEVIEEDGKLFLTPFIGGVPAELHYLGGKTFAIDEFPSNLIFRENPTDGQYYIALERRGFQGEPVYSFVRQD